MIPGPANASAEGTTHEQTPGASSFFARFRTKLILVMLLAAVPAFALVFYGNLEQRRLEKVRVREAATATARLAAANEEKFRENARQLLGTLTQFPFLLIGTNNYFSEG